MKIPIAGLMILLILSLGSPVSAQTIKLGTVAPEGSPWYMIARDMGEAWAKASDGKIQLRIYADRKSTRLNSSHIQKSRMPSSA